MAPRRLVTAQATAALDLDAAVGEAPSLKALLRRAAAHERRGAPASAATDYAAALALDPPNAAEIRAKVDALPAPKKKRRNRKKKSSGGGAEDDAATADGEEASSP